MRVNQVAFATITSTAIGTGLAVFGAVTATSNAALAAFALLTLIFCAVSGASVYTWTQEKSEKPSQYFQAVISNSGVAIAGLTALAGNFLVLAGAQKVKQAFFGQTPLGAPAPLSQK